MMDTLWRDLHYGLRRVAADRRLAVMVVVILSLGIGPNALIFSFLRATLLSPLPFPDAEQLAVISNVAADCADCGVALGQVEQWQTQRELFAGVAGLKLTPRVVLAGVTEPQRLQAAGVSRKLFEVLGVHTALGRVFSQFDTADDQVVISHDLWRRAFNADGGLIGRRILLSGRGYTVVGVMPEAFDFPRLLMPRWGAVDVWLPLRLPPPELLDMTLTVVARLQPSISPQIASRRLTALMTPETRKNVRAVNVVNMRTAVFGKAGSGLLLLAGVVAFVLLLACANITNLLLARADARRADIAIRFALGATRVRVTRQLLTETVLQAVGGAALGLLLALWGTRLVPAMLPIDLPQVQQPRVDFVVMAITLVGTVAATLLSGLAPALTATTEHLATTLSGAARTFTGSRRHHLRDMLVAVEIALAIVLTVAAGLTLRGFWRLVLIRPGFEPGQVFLAPVSIPQSNSQNETQSARFLDSFLRQLGDEPATKAVAAASGIPGVYSAAAASVSLPAAGSAIGPKADLDYVTSGYFNAMGIPLLMGRTFSVQDSAGAPRVAIVDTEVARRLGPGPILHRQILLDIPTPLTKHEIIGIVGRVHLFGAPDDTAPHIYTSLSQNGLSSIMLVVRSRQSAEAVAAALRRVVQTVNPHQPITITALRQRIAVETSGPRFHLIMLGSFGLLALTLAAFGVFSVTEYVVSLRRHEMAVRSSLGASPAALLFLMLGAGTKLLVLGLAAGMSGTVMIAKILAAGFPEVRLNDPQAIGAAVLLVSVAAVGANWMAARRVTRIDLATMLRSL